MLAKGLGINLNLKPTNTHAQEHLTPEFIKINPQHTIPTLVDNGFSVWESRAILSYLVDKYAKDDSLNPKDPKKQAVVNQRLYFDMGTLYSRIIGKLNGNKIDSYLSYLNFYSQITFYHN